MSCMSWFGNTNKFQWVETPSVGVQKSINEWSGNVLFLNGGLGVVRSNQGHVTYDFNYEARVYDNLTVFQQYRNGFYGTGPFYWVDKMLQDMNVMAPAWASPGLIELGWTNISTVVPAFTATPANTIGLHHRSATFSFTAGSVIPTSVNSPSMLLPIPEGDSLNLYVTGSRTGVGAIRVELWKMGANTADSVQNIVPASASGIPAKVTISYANAHYVRIIVSKTSTAVGTVTLSGVIAQLQSPNKVLNPVTKFITGEGNNGLDFLDDAQPVTYQYLDTKITGLSTRLGEVGPWL